MALQKVDVGVVANDGTGDALRDAFIKINANIEELYALVLGAATPGQPAPIWQTIDYNSKVTIGSREWVVTSAENPWNIQMASNYPGLTKFEVRANDNRQGDPTYRERAEFSGSGFAVNSSGAAPTEVWCAYSMVILGTDTARWNTLFQAFALASTGNTITGPVVKLEQRDGTSSQINIAGNIDNSVRAQIDLWNGDSFKMNRQYNIVMRMIFHGESGEFDWWVNGTKLVSVQNRPIGFGASTKTYLKYGIYRDILVGGVEITQPPFTVVFSPLNIVEGQGALLQKVSAPDPMPYYQGIYPLGQISGAYATPPVPTAPAQSTLVAANWAMLAAAGSTATNSPSGTLNLTGGGTSYGAAADQEIITVPGETYDIDFTVANSAVGLRIGTTRGDFQLFPLTSFTAGARTATFVASGDRAWVRFNKQAAELSTVSAIVLSTGTPAVGGGVDEGQISAADWIMLTATGSTATNSPAGQLNLSGGGTSYGGAADQEIVTVPGGHYEVTFTVTGEQVNFRVGSTQGASDLRALISYPIGTRTEAFIATGTRSWLRFNRQAAGTSVVTNISGAVA